MGKSRGPYNEEYPVGTRVRIVGLEDLERFAKEWTFHTPLEKKQFQFAGKTSVVKAVGFYFGGDELYELENVPGLWHEQNLTPVSD